MIKQHPILGTGLGTFEPNYQNELRQILKREKQQMFFACTLYPVPCVIEWVVRDPHNIILSFWLNTGLLGLLAMALLIVNKIRTTFDILRKAKRDTIFKNNIHQIMLGTGLITLIIFGFLDVPYWKNDLALLWWIYLL